MPVRQPAASGTKPLNVYAPVAGLPILPRMSRSPTADLAPLIKLLQAGVPPVRAATELSRVLAIWTEELKDDGEQLQERLSSLAEQMTTGIEEMYVGITEASAGGRIGTSHCARWARRRALGW